MRCSAFTAPVQWIHGRRAVVSSDIKFGVIPAGAGGKRMVAGGNCGMSSVAAHTSERFVGRSPRRNT